MICWADVGYCVQRYGVPQAESYSNLMGRAKRMKKRPAVQKSSIVNTPWGPPEKQLLERHDASDVDGKVLE